MNFDPFVIPGPNPGNNLDTRVVRLVVMNSVTPTAKQLQEAQRYFGLHKLNVRTALGGFLIRNEILSDTSKVRFISNSGMHTIELWPAGSSLAREPIPHGLGITTTWNAPVIYCYRPSTEDWVLGPVPPQLTPEPTGYAQIDRPNGIVLPLVLVKDKGILWDYAPHTVSNAMVGTYVIPVDAEFPPESVSDGTAAFKVHKPHFAADGKIVDPQNNALYTMTDGAQILGEDVTPLPGANDSNGSFTVLQAYRKAVQLPVTAPNRWTFRFWSERIKRTAVASYALDQRYDVDVIAPIGPSQTSTSVIGTDLGSFSFTSTLDNYSVQGGGGWDVGELYAYGYRHTFEDHSSNILANVAYVETDTITAAAPSTINNILALPGVNTIEYANLSVDMTYPGTAFFRGGHKEAGYGALGSTSTWFGIYRDQRSRYDSQHTISGTPKATLQLGWTDLLLLNGVVAGDLEGKYYVDTKDRGKQDGGGIGINVALFAEGEVIGEGQTPKSFYAGDQDFAGEFASEFGTAPAAGETVTVANDQAVTNTGSYSFTTRYVIDYDHKARFYAAIRVEVSCSGAAWGQVAGQYRGCIGKVSDPTYTVSVFFESNWNGTVASQLLATSSGVKPAFEFQAVHHLNVYVYPGDDTGSPFDYYMPPQPSLDYKCLGQLSRLAVHQGANTNLAAADVRIDLPDAQKSASGVEYSYLENTGGGQVERPHTRFVQGQLYARTFTLTELADALWLATQLGLDATLNNAGVGDAWHYFPEIAAVLATKFHIEVRNGVIVQWSDNLPPTPDTTRPDAVDRVIHLYQV